MSRPVAICTLFIPQIVSTDPQHVSPQLVASLRAGRGVPVEPTVIYLPDGGTVIWEPTGEVRTMR